MIIKINMQSEIPIYLQLRNEIVKGIGRGEFEPGESLPTVRQMATDLGINTMTVSKAYQLLKTEGFLETDRRKGTTICYPTSEALLFAASVGSMIDQFFPSNSMMLSTQPISST